MADETSTAVQREADWLNTTGDGLPDLKSAGWGVVQAYWPGNRFATQKPGIYVLRRHLDDNHPMAQRYRPQYQITLKVVWPIRVGTPNIAEKEQQAFDTAIGYLLQRIRGPVGDKTHGGRFLSVAEIPEQGSVSVVWDDPELTIEAAKELRATVTYYADDIEFTG